MNLILFIVLLLISLHANLPFFRRAYQRHNRFDLFAPNTLFPISFALIYGAGILKLSPLEKEIPSEHYYLYGISLCYYFIGLLAGRIFSPKRSKILAQNRKTHLEQPTIICLLIFTIVVSAFVLIKAGNPLFSSDMNTARTLVVQSVGGWLYYLYRTTAIAISIYLCSLYINPSNNLFGTATTITLSSIALFVIVSSGYRGQILTVALTVIIFYHYKKKEIRVGSFSIILIGLLLFFGLFGAMRSAGESNPLAILDRLLLELQTPAMSVYRISEVIPSKYSYFGVSILVYPILSILPGEQIAYGLILKDMLGLNFAGGGFVPSLTGGFYLIWGNISVYIGMLLYGFIYNYVYNYTINKSQTYITIFYSYLTVYLLNSIRGGFFQEILPIWFMLILLSFHVAFDRKGA